MVPLSWAVAKTLEYNPSDPVHFIGYKLLQWTCNNISQTEKDKHQQLIALSTIKMDHKLIVSIIYNNFQCLKNSSFISINIINTMYIISYIYIYIIYINIKH